MIAPLRRISPALTAAIVLLVPTWLASPLGCRSGDGSVEGDETVESQVRADWVLWSFADGDVLRDDAGAPLAVDDPASVAGWDLALSQWVAATNSGASAHPDSVSRGALLAVEGTTDAWASLEEFDGRCSDFVASGETTNKASFGCSSNTPTVDDGYIVDQLDDPDGAGPFPERGHNPSLSFWFEYDIGGHGVTPFGHVYVLETHDGDCVKLQLTDYYDATGESGFISFSWDWLPQ